ncbi:MAG: hypothetical protein HQ536_04670 [Parcubacteria group bacterium]|nr:hypothetical protein [Parcubacteria group bacterium]
MADDKLAKTNQKNVAIQELRKTVIAPIRTVDIKEYHENFLDRASHVISFTNITLASIGVTSAIMFFSGIFLGGFLLKMFIGGLSATMPITAHYFIDRFFIKPKKLREPMIRLETVLAKIIAAYNERVQTVRLLESGEKNGLSIFEEKEDVYKRLAELQIMINGLVKKFRTIKRAHKGAKEFKERLECALKNPQKILPVDTTEIDLALQSSMLLQQDDFDKLGEREQELNIKLQNLLAEVSQ